MLATLLVLGVAWGMAPATASPAQLVETGRRSLSPRLLELTMRTPDLATATKVRVLLPTGYNRGSRRYPVLYLLNGGAGSWLDWTDLGAAEQLTAKTSVIVVMPDGGSGGNYTNWYGPDGGTFIPQWESYHIGQLLPWVDKHFRTLAERSQRAVAGPSMGGNGALHYAARHPDLFVAVASFSGANDVFHPIIYPITETTGMADGALPGAVFGPRLTQEVRWHASNPVDLASNLKGTWVSLAFGNGMPGGPAGEKNVDTVEVAVHDSNVSLHNQLLKAGVPHLYDDYGPGGHTWFYWQRDLRSSLPELMKVFAQRRAAPTHFSFSSIDAAYQVYGWSVRLNRPVLEQSQLVDASSSGFALRGSGTAVVQTSALYRVGQRLRLAVRDAGGTRSTNLTIGKDRRLSVSLNLGAPNPYQQYTLPAQLTGTAVREARVSIS